MFERVLGHFTILFWGFGTKTNEDFEKRGGIENNGIKVGQGPNCSTQTFFRV